MLRLEVHFTTSDSTLTQGRQLTDVTPGKDLVSEFPMAVSDVEIVHDGDLDAANNCTRSLQQPEGPCGGDTFNGYR